MLTSLDGRETDESANDSRQRSKRPCQPRESGARRTNFFLASTDAMARILSV